MSDTTEWLEFDPEPDPAPPATVEPEPEPHPGYIRLQIDMQYDARSQGKFVKAPDNWADMDEVARLTFLEDEAERYRDEEIEFHGTWFATADDARRAAAEAGGWGVDFDEDDVEEIY